MIKKLHIVLLLIVQLLMLSETSLSAQVILGDKHYGTFRKGVNAADRGDYMQAISLFHSIINEKPDHIDALTQLGITYMDSNHNLDSAIVLFNNVLEILNPEDHFDPFGIYLQQAKARTYNLKHEPHNALPILEAIRDSISNEELITEIDRDIKHATNSIILLNNPIRLKISDLGEGINSEFDDHSPLISLTGNKMFFTSRRPVGRDRIMQDGQYPENIFMSEFNGEKWQAPTLLKDLFKRNEHVAILSISPDGTQLYLYKTNPRGRKNIYVSNLINNKWEEPVELPYPINTHWDETHASLSPDQNTLYFTSNRPGGYGGLDIYSISKNEFGQWQEPINLGSGINTFSDEETPMMHPDGNTLYFISEGHSSMGGFDVFYSQKMSNKTWAKAVNMGYPINSSDDDLFFLPTLDKSQAFLSSYRFSESKGRSSIYKVTFEEQKSGSLAVIEGEIKNPDNLPIEHVRVLVWRESDNTQVGSFRPNQHTGKYVLLLEAEENYLIQEATPEIIRDIETIYISQQLAYKHSNRVFMVQDVNMLSPLVQKNQEVAIIEDEEDVVLQNLAEATNVVDEIQKETLVNTAESVTNEESSTAIAQNLNNEYTIQILALRKRIIASPEFLEGLETGKIKTYKGKDGFLRYSLGVFNNKDDANNYLKTIGKKEKLSDAWIRNIDEIEKISE